MIQTAADIHTEERRGFKGEKGKTQAAMGDEQTKSMVSFTDRMIAELPSMNGKKCL